VKRSNTGLGLFAGEDIPKGTRIIEYVGHVLSNEEAAELRTRYLFQLDRKRLIDGSPRWNKARYINHRCRPNAEAGVKRGRVFITAIKKIKAGEEITYDYGKEYFDRYIKPRGCKCHAHGCRSAAKSTPARAAKLRTSGAAPA
jgi:SET domain-containing protein